MFRTKETLEIADGQLFRLLGEATNKQWPADLGGSRSEEQFNGSVDSVGRCWCFLGPIGTKDLKGPLELPLMPPRMALSNEKTLNEDMLTKAWEPGVSNRMGLPFFFGKSLKLKCNSLSVFNHFIFLKCHKMSLLKLPYIGIEKIEASWHRYVAMWFARWLLIENTLFHWTWPWLRRWVGHPNPRAWSFSKIEISSTI